MTDELAIIQTVDFFTPIVDDPYWFGQIAAANAISDVYAMGGVPKTAMNIMAFPLKEMDLAIFRQIIQGGLDKMKEAGVVLVGGHSIEDNELKYGLSVTGFVHPDRILTKHNLKIGDCLILTKPLGTGIINTAIKGGLASSETVETTTRLMATLNKGAAEIMRDFPVNACTDITGFGLIGHIAEMLVSSGLGVCLRSRDIPVIEKALEYAEMGLVPAGTFKNREFRAQITDISSSVDLLFQDVLFDPQTSGGLLISVEKESAPVLMARLRQNGIEQAAVIGEVRADPQGRILVE